MSKRMKENYCVANNIHKDFLRRITKTMKSNKPAEKKDIMIEYFSKCFKIISIHEAKKLWDSDDKSFCILRHDGTDCYAAYYEKWEDIPEGVYFGIEKQVAMNG